MSSLRARRIARNPFAFPGGSNPGINASHFAAKTLRFSGVPFGANYVNLMSGQVGTRSGAGITAGVNAAIGPNANAAANTDYVTFSGQPAVQDLGVTCAAILNWNSITTGGIFTAHSGDNGWGFYYSTALSSLVFRVNGAGAGTPSPALVPTTNVPYFVVFSGFYNGTSYNEQILMRRLDTGVTTYGSRSDTTAGPTACDGTYRLFNLSATTAFHHGNLGPVMFAGRSLSQAEMYQFADRPWDFWYPVT